MNQQLPEWVLAIERLGMPSVLIIVAAGFAYKLLPAWAKLLNSWRQQSDAITKAVPSVLANVSKAVHSLEQIAKHVRPNQKEDDLKDAS